MKCSKCGGEWIPPPGVNLVKCPFCNEPLMTTAPDSSPNSGETIQFGKYKWRVLDVQNNKILIITEDIIEIRPYDAEFTDETWETCTLRQYLNGEFLHKFTEEEQKRIAETKIHNSNNQWYGTWGGKDTYDKVFLLSLEEADRYFGGGGDYINERRKEYDFDNAAFNADGGGSCYSNAYDDRRQAKYGSEMSFWWLRSPGILGSSAAFVFDNGGVGVFGLDNYSILDVICGVRPVLWLNV